MTLSQQLQEEEVYCLQAFFPKRQYIVSQTQHRLDRKLFHSIWTKTTLTDFLTYNAIPAFPKYPFGWISMKGHLKF